MKVAGIWLGCFLSLSVLASETPTTEGQFSLDKGLVDSLYQELVTEEKIGSKQGASSLQMQAAFSYLVPTTLALSNQYFDIQYAEAFSGLPSMGLAVSQTIWSPSIFAFSVVGRTGFSRKEALTTVRTKAGAPFKDMIQLSRVPLLAGFRIDAKPFGSFPVQPFLEGTTGVQWLYQSGKLDKALEQGFWIPLYQLAFGLTLFADTAEQNWFGGVNLGASVQKSFGSNQVANLWAMDLGMSLNL